MASANLVRLFNNSLSAGHQSFSYGCDQFESVFLSFYKSGTGAYSAGDASTLLTDVFVSISAGTETIVNRVEIGALADINQYESGTGQYDIWTGADTVGGICFEIETGTHFLDKGAELQVDIVNNCTETGTQKPACCIGAKVNGVAPPSPSKIIKRTDSAFMIPAVETLYVWDLDGDFVDSDEEVNLQYGTENVTIPLDVSFAQVLSDTVGDAGTTGSLACIYDGIPRDMQINTSAAGLTFIAHTKDVVSQPQVAKARRWIPNKLKSLSPKERVLLAQGS